VCYSRVRAHFGRKTTGDGLGAASANGFETPLGVADQTRVIKGDTSRQTCTAYRPSTFLLFGSTRSHSSLVGSTLS